MSETEVTNTQPQLTPAEIVEQRLQETRTRMIEANAIIMEGKGKLRLETPIKKGDTEITELSYDFTTLTGLEYTDAMDNDSNANSAAYRRITYRQGLALFAKAAAKQTDGLDMQDILENLGGTDAVEGVQLATLFFTASTRAGLLRISKKS